MALRVDVGFAVRPCSGHRQSGDAVTRVRRGGQEIVAIADGLGHGPHAAEAAEAFIRTIEHSDAVSTEDLLDEAHHALASTRGCAAYVVSIDPHEAVMMSSGVGNIAVRTSDPARLCAVSMPGIIGKRIRTIRSFMSPLRAGDVLVLHSDGIGSRFELKEILSAGDRAQAAAEALVDRFGKSHDDASCAVVKLA